MTGQRIMTGGFRKSLWIPALFIGAMSLVVAVNGIMVYFATSTFPGLDTDKAYVHGLAYNETLRESKASEALGWTATATVIDGRLAVDLRTEDGGAVTGIDLRGRIVRPATTSMDREIVMSPHPSQPGRYETSLDLPGRGLWELRLVAADARGGTTWQSVHRVIVP